jgi:hypothetical protein
VDVRGARRCGCLTHALTVVSAFPDVHLELRKRLPFYAVELLVGTDVHVVESVTTAEGGPSYRSCLAGYKPNLHCSCHDRILGGAVGLSTKDNELSYTKTYSVQGAAAPQPRAR